MKGVDSAHRRNPLPFNLLPAPPPEAGRLFRGAVCSPLPANPCGSVPGSKFFTQFPRRHLGPAGFSKRGLLPAPGEPLRLRFGEQNLHTIPAPLPGTGRLFRGAVCSPLPANPCGSVPGSKIFTQFPRRHSRPAGFSEARFAPPSPRGLVLPSGGANSSHNSRAPARGRPLFPGRGLLPAPRKPLWLRSGEQNLHTISAPPI